MQFNLRGSFFPASVGRQPEAQENRQQWRSKGQNKGKHRKHRLSELCVFYAVTKKKANSERRSNLSEMHKKQETVFLLNLVTNARCSHISLYFRQKTHRREIISNSYKIYKEVSEMQSVQGVQLAGYERLMAVLKKVPTSRAQQVDERAAIFVSGMEAMARAQSPAPERTEARPRA